MDIGDWNIFIQKMNCDLPDCDAAGKICDAHGVQFVADIEIQEAKEPLDERVNKSQRIKN